MSLLEMFPEGRIIDERYQIVHATALSERNIRAAALDLRLDRLPLTLKIFHVDDTTSNVELERFRSEVIITRKLSHPNIEAVYDIGRFDSSFFYISSQAIEGITLSNLKSQLKTTGVPFTFAIELLYQLLHALRTSHNAGIIHRNITPDNIYIELNENFLKSVKLANFGLGKRLEKNMELTRTGETVVSRSIYCSPEQIMGEILDERADIYSLGVVISEMLSNLLPLDLSDHGTDPLDLLSGKLLPDLNKTRPDLPGWFTSLLKRMSRKNRQERFQSAKEVQKHILHKLGYQSKHLFKTQGGKKGFPILGSFFKNSRHHTSSGLSMVLGLAILGMLATGIPAYWINRSGVSSDISTADYQIFEAVKTGDEAEVFRLLSHGISPEIRDGEDKPLLHHAVSRNDMAVVYTLVSHSPDILSMQDGTGMTAFDIARANNHTDMLSLLKRFQDH